MHGVGGQYSKGSPKALALIALRENRGLCLNCHEDNHSFKDCRHPFINASGCLNPELVQLGDDDAYRRWRARMVCYRRDGKSAEEAVGLCLRTSLMYDVYDCIESTEMVDRVDLSI